MEPPAEADGAAPVPRAVARRRVVGAVSVALVAVLLVVLAVTAYLGRGRTYSFGEAADAAATTTRARYDNHVFVDGVVRMSTEGVVDGLRTQSRTVVDASDGGAALTLESVLDAERAVMYRRTGAGTGDSTSDPGTTAWEAVDLTAAAEGVGIGTDELRRQLASSWSFVGLFVGARASEVGMSMIGGEAVKQFHVVLDIDALLADNPLVAIGAGDDWAADLAATADAEVFVTRDNRLRRVAMTVHEDSGPVVSILDIEPLDDREHLELPVAADVTFLSVEDFFGP